MSSPEKIEALIRQCWDAPFGAGQIALAEEAIAQADALGDEELRFEARMVATNAYQHGGEPAKGFVTFSWCLAWFDRDPGRFGHAEVMMLWHFKYMVGSLTKFPEVPLSRTYAVLDDMQRRYHAGGHSLQAVHKYRWRVAMHLGDVVARDEHYERWQTAARDTNSDCHGCDPTDQVWHLAQLGRYEEAIALTEPVLAGQLTCAEQPQSILTQLLLPYLLTGRLDAARAAHHSAYRAIRGNHANLADLSEHLYFLAVSGNATYGVELIRRHLSWLDKAPTPWSEMWFSASAALVLRLAMASGGDREVSPGRVASVLCDELTARATGLALLFDTRNGTGHQSKEVAARLTAEPLGAQLPLSLSAQLGLAAAIVVPAKDRAAAEVLPEVPDGDLDELLELAEEAIRRDDSPQVEALWRKLSRYHRNAGSIGRQPAAPSEPVLTRPGSAAPEPPEPALTGPEPAGVELTGLQRARLDDLAGMRVHDDDPGELVRLWTRACAGYAAAGDGVREQRTRGRLGLVRCRNGEPEEGLAEVRATTEYLIVHGSATDRASALRRLSFALLQAGYPAEAVSTLEHLSELAEPDPGPRVRLQSIMLKAQALGADGRFEAALAQAQSLIEAAHAAGEPELVAVGEFIAGQSQLSLEDGQAAVQAYERALAQPELPFELLREVRERRAMLLAGTGRAAEAIDDLAGFVARLVAQRHEEEADYARFQLGVALFNADRPADAAEVAEEALYGADRSDAQGLADQIRHLLASVYQRLDEPNQALGHLDQLALNLNGFDHAFSRGRVLEQAGDLLFELDKDLTAAQRFGAAAQAFEVAGTTIDHLRALRRQAVATMFGIGSDAAVEVLASADRVAVAIDSAEPEMRYELAWLALDGARVLAGSGQPDLALARVGDVPQRFRELESFGEAFLAELTMGEVLLTVGQPAEAERVLRGVVGGLPRDAGPLPRAAYALAHALMQLDKADQARRLAEQFGFELD